LFVCPSTLCSPKEIGLTTNDHAQLIIDRLTQAGAKDPDLHGFYEFHASLYRLLYDAKRKLKATLELTDQDALDARIRQGLPMLSFAQLPIERHSFARLVRQVADMLARFDPGLAGQALPGDTDDWMLLPEQRFNDNQAAAQKPSDSAANLAELAVDLALKPYLEWAAVQILPHLDQAQWRHGYCPVCGGSPDLAVLTEKAGARQLVCARCNSQWLYRRVGCPFCNTTDHTKITYYPSEDDFHRLYVCGECQRYLKTINLGEARRRFLVEVERVITVDMDVAAREEGYH
jgi:FdhE protein